MLEAIENGKKIELEKFLFALGIRHVGEETAVLIAKAINTEFQISNFKFLNKSQNQKSLPDRQAGKIQNLQDVVDNFPKITIEQWTSIKGIGDKSAESLVQWFNDKNNLNLLEKMKASGVEVGVTESENVAGGKLTGKTFVLTGELLSFTRDEAKDMIRKAGGDISSSVSKKTDYVVAGENPGSKYQKASELGVKIINEEEFKKLFG